MDKLGTLLKQANLRKAANQQIRQLQKVVERDRVLYYGNGCFAATRELICYAKAMHDLGNKSYTILDDHQRPVEIHNPEDFFKRLIAKEREAVNAYTAAYNRVISSKSVEDIYNK